MIGSLFAGTEESPGETVIFQGRSYKIYRGMGSEEAMKAGSRDRYYQEDTGRGIQAGARGHRGPGALPGETVRPGLPAGGRACAPAWATWAPDTIAELQTKAKFVRITPAGLRESHVHDVIIMKEAPNYWLE